MSNGNVRRMQIYGVCRVKICSPTPFEIGDMLCAISISHSAFEVESWTVDKEGKQIYVIEYGPETLDYVELPWAKI